MKIKVPSRRLPFTLEITVRTNRPETIKIVARDVRKKHTKYVDRKGKVDGIRKFELKFPVSPDEMMVSVFNRRNGNRPLGADPTFVIEDIRVKKLTEYDVWMSQEDKSFYDFALFFAQNAGTLDNKAGSPAIYQSNDGRYTIAYYDVIRDNNGKPLSTPARIGHQSGVIDASFEHFKDYTVSMRFMILLHEYAHKYKNPKAGKPIEDETSADIHGLYMYLGKGFSEIEAHQAFLTVFADSNNEANHKRYKIIRDFIDKYNRGKVERKK